MFTRYYNLIQRVDIHGGDLTTVYTGGVPRGLDFDYRLRPKRDRIIVLSNFVDVLMIEMITYSGLILPVTGSIELTSMGQVLWLL